MTTARRDTVAPDARLAGAYITVGLVALFGGMITGLLQALTLAGVQTPAHFLVQSYYHSVSLHGVLNVLLWTTFFICGFVPFIASRALATPLHHCLGWATFWVMIAGLVLAAIPLVANAATVMFTFYPPLKAPWAFYVDLTLVVVGTWLVMLNLTLTWRRGGPRVPIPGPHWRPSCRSSPS
jgi:cytochrome c oxidase subunit 1